MTNTVFNLAVYRIGNTYNAKNELYLTHVYYKGTIYDMNISMLLDKNIYKAHKRKMGSGHI